MRGQGRLERRVAHAAGQAGLRGPAGGSMRLRQACRAVAALMVAALLSSCATDRLPMQGASRTVPTPSPGRVESGAASGLESAYVQVVERVSPSVVLIQTPRGLGSGVVLDAKGHILTNHHVVSEAKKITVVAPDGRRYDGALRGAFPPEDLAVIRAEGSNLQPARFGDSNKLRVGEIVLAIGNPLGLQSSVTTGIVSAVGRTISLGPDGPTLLGAIQTSAPINPGNSGGALVNLDGEVVGIPTLAATNPEAGGVAPGIGFAVASSRALDLANQIVQSGHVTNPHRAYLGVEVANISGPRVLVASVTPGGPAERAGIAVGDIIVRVGGKEVTSAAALATRLAHLEAGQRVAVDLIRAGHQETVQVELASFPTADHVLPAPPESPQR